MTVVYIHDIYHSILCVHCPLCPPGQGGDGGERDPSGVHVDPAGRVLLLRGAQRAVLRHLAQAVPHLQLRLPHLLLPPHRPRLLQGRRLHHPRHLLHQLLHQLLPLLHHRSLLPARAAHALRAPTAELQVRVKQSGLHERMHALAFLGPLTAPSGARGQRDLVSLAVPGWARRVQWAVQFHPEQLGVSRGAPPLPPLQAQVSITHLPPCLTNPPWYRCLFFSPCLTNRF